MTIAFTDALAFHHLLAEKKIWAIPSTAILPRHIVFLLLQECTSRASRPKRDLIDQSSFGSPTSTLSLALVGCQVEFVTG